MPEPRLDDLLRRVLADQPQALEEQHDLNAARQEFQRRALRVARTHAAEDVGSCDRDLSSDRHTQQDGNIRDATLPHNDGFVHQLPPPTPLANAETRHQARSAPVGPRWYDTGQRWLPTVAAAVITGAVVTGAVILPQRGVSVGPVQVFVDARQMDAPSASGGAPDFVVAPPPQESSFRTPDAGDLCGTKDVAATLSLSGQHGFLRLEASREGISYCTLPSQDPSLVLVNGGSRTVVPTTYPAQPEVPNPPARPDAHLHAGTPLTAPITWRSLCKARRGRLQLEGMATQPLPVTVRGDLPECSGSEGAALGMFSVESDRTRYGVVPEDRAGLRVTVRYPEVPAAGVETPYEVEIRNPTSRPITLRPCPSWSLYLERPDPINAETISGSRYEGVLPCSDLPESLAPGRRLSVLLEQDFGDDQARSDGDSRWVRATWGFAGTAPDVQRLQLRYPKPRVPVADVPWRDTPAPPGRPRDPSEGDELPYGMLVPTLEALPARVRPGQLLQYKVRLDNTSSVPLRLSPCPGFVQIAGSLTDEHYLNCAAAPAAIPAGAAVVFAMQLQLPDNLAIGGRVLLQWKIGKDDTGGSQAASAAIGIAR